jgi:hypothetical protein
VALTKNAVISKAHKLGRSAVKAMIANAGLNLESRQQLIDSSSLVALADFRFTEHVAAGDRHRDNGQWRAAEAAYAAALSLFPYEHSFWVQHGHMAKELGKFARAEISYRTACALGVVPHDVEEHLRFVMARQQADEGRYPIRFHRTGATAQQVPGQPDAMLLARLVWRVGGMDDEDLLHLLRSSATCDDLLVTMIRDPRFERANRDWLELVEEDEL